MDAFLVFSLLVSNVIWGIPCGIVLWAACLAFNFVTRPPNLNEEHDDADTDEAKDSADPNANPSPIVNDENPYSPPHQVTDRKSKKLVQSTFKPGVPLPHIGHAFGVCVLGMMAGTGINVIFWKIHDLAFYRFDLDLPLVVFNFFYVFGQWIWFMCVLPALLIYMLPTSFKKSIGVTAIAGCIAYALCFAFFRVAQSFNWELTGWSSG